MRTVSFGLYLCLLTSFGRARSATAKAPEPTLPAKEIEALKAIDAKLRVGWEFSVNPCSGHNGWLIDWKTTFTARNVTCGDCNATTNVCHVVSIMLKSQNLTGVLPAEFANLKSLEQLDLARNYINGTIPPEWGVLPLINLTILGNRISGKIPEEIGNISTLQSLVLENNLLEGPIPQSFGRLTNLTRLILGSNYLIGEIPDSLSNLLNLNDLIDGTGISGNIPTFIYNWTKLLRLFLQGTSLEGPFPSTFGTLSSLIELRVSDFKGDGNFPLLEGLDLKILILRNCSISGRIPAYLGNMQNLIILDLSFNYLTGEIPSTLEGLGKSIINMYLTNNNLTGPIPKWILDSKRYIDVSYNSFSDTSAPGYCKHGNVNLFASCSSSTNRSIDACFKKNFPCPEKSTNYELFINCGGNKVDFEGNEYDEDSSPLGSSTFFLSGSKKWASSSTGDFGFISLMDNLNAKFIATNTSALNISHPELYMSARLNPLSLKYYGLCLQKGNYKVNLHFAEILFTNDETFSNVGRRIFDLSIQGKRVLEDFNIVKEAKGAGRNIMKTFIAQVEHGTLEIHFQWGGKGTNSIPTKGVYGPLISAISITPNFTRGKSLPLGAILGIAAAALFPAIAIVIIVLFYFRKRSQKNASKVIELKTGHFSLEQIKSATGNFNSANIIGEGGFGPVYKGVLLDGSLVAVKQLSSKSKQGNREFINEIGTVFALQHPNLVKLLGCCIEENQLLLIYEYMENNSLARALFGLTGVALKLDWQIRRNICLGVAKGLAFIHEESRLKIVHRDIKATNVLLDKELRAKISDFGLAKLNDQENIHISTRIVGTRGYMAPEYAMMGHLSDKADVYSFGVVMLEVVCGRSITDVNYKLKEPLCLLDEAYALATQGRLLELVDPLLGSDYSKEEAQQMLNLVLICTSQSPTNRPSMTSVVSMLESGKPVQVTSVRRALNERTERLEIFQEPGTSEDGPWIDSAFIGDSTIGMGASKDQVTEGCAEEYLR